MVRGEIERLLKSRIGLNVRALGDRTIEKTISQRAAEHRATPLEYLELLKNSPRELTELVECLMVPETWFFRDRESFRFLHRYLLQEWLPQKERRPLQVLSLPCSTGEEPYSIVMALFEAGLQADRFAVDAADISHRALEKARQGTYTKNSFRGQLERPYWKYFHTLDRSYQVCDRVRQQVRFARGNILQPIFFARPEQYDIIFFRNLLIYLDPSVRPQCTNTIARLLKPGGLLFVGYAETGEIDLARFASVRHPLAFGYRKKIASPSLAVSDTASEGASSTIVRGLLPSEKAQPPDTSLQTDTFLQPDAPLPAKTESDRPQISQRNDGQPLERARQLADRGDLEGALQLCQTHLNSHWDDANAYLLSGEIHQSMGFNSRAEKCFRRALYLEPNCHEALVHLVLIEERNGDRDRAAILRQRIQRLSKEG